MNIFQLLKKRKSVKLLIDSWDKVSINDYIAIRDIISSKLLTDEQKNLNVLAILMKKTEEEIEDYSIADISNLIGQMGWLKAFNFPKNKRYSSMMVGKYKCKVMANMAEWNIAQYIDFQNLWGSSDITEVYGKLLAVFLIPTGATYNHGYSIEDVANEIEDKVSISDANGLCFFFLKSCLSLTKVIRLYLGWMMKRIRKKAKSQKNQVMIEQINLVNKEMDKIVQFLIG